MTDPHRDDDAPADTGGLAAVPDTDPDAQLVTCADWCPPDEPEHDPECGCGRRPERSW